MRKWMKLTALMLAMLALCALCCGAMADGENLLVNGSFEELTGDGLPAGWNTDAWVMQSGYTVWRTESDKPKDGAHYAVIDNIGDNDARFAQTVAVEPESLYRFSGWVQAEDVADAGWGVNLSVSGVYAYTEGYFDSQGEWRYIELYGETGPDQHEVTVYARLGGYSGESTGHAAFDALELCKVDELPDDVVADLWFRDTTPAQYDDDDDEGEDAVAAPFWPWLIVLSAVYVIAALACVRWLREARKPGKQVTAVRMPLFLTVGLLLSFLLRWLIASQVEGHGIDLNCFLSWGSTMASVGPTQFYQTVSFCDYPPGYVYVMGLNGLVNRWLASVFSAGVPAFLRPSVIIKLVPMLCDVGLAYLTWRIAREYMSRKAAGVLALIVAFNPVLIINSAAWCQIDSVLALLLLAVAWLAIRRKWAILMPVYMLAVLAKPQALMLGFLGLTAIVIAWIRRKEDRKPMLIGVGLAAAVAAVVLVPFSVHQPLNWIIDKYAETLSSYAYATVNTTNLYYLFQSNWDAIEHTAKWGVPVVLALLSAGWGVWMALKLRKKQLRLWQLEPVMMAAFTLFFLVCAFTAQTWAVVGYGAMALAFAVVLPLYVRAGKAEALPLMGGVLFLLLYVTGIKMHERYLFPALALFAAAYAMRHDRRILWLLLATSVTMFINEGIVLDNTLRLGTSGGHLNNDTLALNMILSALNVIAVPFALWTAGEVCLEEATFDQPLVTLPAREGDAARLADYQPDARLHWKRLDTLLMLAITLIYAVVGFWHLGSTKAPQTTYASSTADEYVVIDLGEHRENFSMLYYTEVSYHDFMVSVSDDGESWSEPYWAQVAQGLCFRWQYVLPVIGEDGEAHTFAGLDDYNDVQKFSGRYVRIETDQIGLRLNEVIFRETVTDESGNQTSGAVIPASIVGRFGGNEASPNYSDPACLLDEQDAIEGEPCWYSGTYFDEIYHARTAWEHLHGENPYETTHPPLGKVLMSWAVAIFGMTPFGWRFAGVLAGVLMLPGMYLLAKQLTKRTDMASLAALLMALDCMHYAQTRIATIDSFPVLFIIWAYLFMARFLQRDLMKETVRTLLPDLALSGLFMGLAVASKWIGVYAGAGLAVLFFWHCGRHIRLSNEAAAILSSGAKLTSEERAALKVRSEKVLQRLLHLCLWCLLFFVAVPLAIYLLAYIPYIAPKHPAGLGDYLAKVMDAQNGMLSYHSTPRLGMDHPFYSPWYEWPLNVKPMYYAMSYFAPAGKSMSIFCFSNPAVTLPALAALLVVVWLWLKPHLYAKDGRTLHALGNSWDVTPAFLLIGLLAQYLPWVLVPRGTYIYHYFASLPFLILMTVWAIYWISQRSARAGRILMVVSIAAALIFFVLLYPYASGAMVSTDWLNIGNKLLHVYYR